MLVVDLSSLNSFRKFLDCGRVRGAGLVRGTSRHARLVWAVYLWLFLDAYYTSSARHLTSHCLKELEIHLPATSRCVEKLHSQMGDVMEVMGLGSLEKKSPLMAAYLDTLALKNYPVEFV